MRADRAVEPTKSENITVTWRRSARSSGEALGRGRDDASAEGALALVGTESRNGIKEYPAMTDASDAKFLQVLLGEVREDRLV